MEKEIDKITLSTALSWKTWMMVWKAAPRRKIYVEMTYDDLVRIVDLMKEAYKRNN